ncbi:MAG TPA: efflux RND transporter periplasmic adaptor subunit [Candidatus Sulfopaludibacter sp.]|jgi:HlyD family secretion protein|nr:efflux RND transporter periplasmic adaptor subunit [Candidatus Sulfopaludibacter sp.]
MKKRILVIVILVAGAAAVFAYRGRNRQPENRIVVSGNIELTEVNIAFKTAGRLIERTVDEGDAVKKGQEIARLDRDQLMAQRAAQVAAIQSAESQLAQAQTSVEWQKATLSADIETRNADLASNQARLAELKNGARPQEKLDAQAAVDSAQAELQRAQRDWDRAQKLYKDDDISTAQYDQFRSRWETATAAVNSAKERQALVLAGPRVEQVNAASGQVERARGALKGAEANTLEMKRREQEITTRRAEIERSKATLALIDSQLADTVAVSPVDGVVLVKSADVGEVLAPGTTVVTVGDIEHPWLRGYINETDLGKVKLGSVVHVTTDSYPGKTYNGKVTFIASEAEFTPKQIQTQQERVKLVYRVKIELDNSSRELKSNMPADGEIVLQ